MTKKLPPTKWGAIFTLQHIVTDCATSNICLLSRFVHKYFSNAIFGIVLGCKCAGEV